jgi:hypothetical protein
MPGDAALAARIRAERESRRLELQRRVAVGFSFHENSDIVLDMLMLAACEGIAATSGEDLFSAYYRKNPLLTQFDMKWPQTIQLQWFNCFDALVQHVRLHRAS